MFQKISLFKKQLLVLMSGAILLLFIFPISSYYMKPHKMPSSIMVTSGMTITQIREELGFKNHILNRMYDLISFDSPPLYKGYYPLRSDESFLSLNKRLLKGEEKSVIITIPEGYSQAQIVSLLSHANIITEAEFKQALQLVKDFPYPTPNLNFQGYLFPSTYRFYVGEPSNEVVSTFLSEFTTLFNPAHYGSSNKFYQQLIIASMVEKEVKNVQEMPQVAGIFYNRLAAGMRLQSDATVTYATGIAKLTGSDLKIDSPYNTYLHAGVPPTPICNPGMSAIKSSLRPSATPYYYFITTPKGDVKFATTYAEQQQNIANYL